MLAALKVQITRMELRASRLECLKSCLIVYNTSLIQSAIPVGPYCNANKHTLLHLTCLNWNKVVRGVPVLQHPRRSLHSTSCPVDMYTEYSILMNNCCFIND